VLTPLRLFASVTGLQMRFVSEDRGLDQRMVHLCTTIFCKVVIATRHPPGLRQGDTTRVTVVPVITTMPENCATEDVLKFDKISIVTYR
jgi:hypothetical protein